VAAGDVAVVVVVVVVDGASADVVLVTEGSAAADIDTDAAANAADAVSTEVPRSKARRTNTPILDLVIFDLPNGRHSLRLDRGLVRTGHGSRARLIVRKPDDSSTLLAGC
jgi:hypothetical protein